MERRYKVLIWVIVLIALFSLIYYSITRPIKDMSSVEKDSLAKCITSKGISLYGAPNCPNCVIQKEMFNESIQFINYIDCDKQKDGCRYNDGKRPPIPFWKINETIVHGPVPLKFLKITFGC